MGGKLTKAKKRELGTETNRPIGDSGLNELFIPSGYQKLEIFADTETYYCTNGIEPGNWIGKKDGLTAMSCLIVKPIILVGQYKNVGGEKAGEWVKHRSYIRENDLDEIHYFMSNLSYIYNELNLTPILYFHNSSYDIPILASLFKQLDPDLILYFYAVRESKNFIRGCMQSKAFNFFCEFGDTLKYDRTMSIERAGLILGKPKIEGFPYGMCDPKLIQGMIVFRDMHTGEKKMYSMDKAMEYAERDVDIMREFHLRRLKLNELENKQMVDNWNRVNKAKFGKRCQTRPQHSKMICNKYLESHGWGSVDEVFRFNLNNEYENASDVDSMYKRTIESNCGGFTSFNKNIHIYDCDSSRVIKYFDVNSMYPGIMTGALPYGSILTEPPADTKDYTTWYCVSLRACKWKGKMDCIKNQAFSMEKLTDFFFFVEDEYWKFILENCEVDYDLEHIYYQRNTRIVGGLINKYFDRRAAIKKEMEGLSKSSTEYTALNDTQNGLKTLMNSLYGKMCEKGYHVNVVYNDLKFTTYKNKERKHPCILTGSFITYRARLTLLKKIKKVLDCGYDFLYADTDSIILGCGANDDLTSIFGKDDGRIGGGKLEGTFDLYLSIWKKKKYILANRTSKECKMALSGIPKVVHKVFHEQMKNDFNRVINDFIKLFNPNENYVIRNCKPYSMLNLLDQQVIFNTHFAMNSCLRQPTGYMRIEGNDYVIE